MRLISNSAWMAPAILGLVLLVAPVQAVEEAAWDQARAAALAPEFEKTVTALHRTAKIENRDPNQAKSAEIYLLVQDIQSLSRISRRLSRQLSNGQGRAETDPLFRRLMVIVRDINAQRASAPILENSGAEIDEARRVLGELAAYYGQVLPPPVAAPGRD